MFVYVTNLFIFQKLTAWAVAVGAEMIWTWRSLALARVTECPTLTTKTCTLSRVQDTPLTVAEGEERAKETKEREEVEEAAKAGIRRLKYLIETMAGPLAITTTTTTIITTTIIGTNLIETTKMVEVACYYHHLCFWFCLFQCNFFYKLYGYGGDMLVMQKFWILR